MTSPNRRTVLSLLLVFSSLLPVSAQGLYWKSTRTLEGTDETEEFYYMPKMFKTIAQDGEIAIFRIDKNVLYTVNPKEKQYSEIPFAELDRILKGMGEKMKAAADQMRESLKNLPEEQRKQLEQMMGGGGKQTPVEVKNTGEKKTIGGYGCTKHVVQQGDKELATAWTTLEIKEFGAMRDDFEEFSKRMMGMNPMGGSLVEGLQKVEGFPMKTEYVKRMKMVVSKVEKRSFSVSEFEVPSGYEKVKSKLEEQLDDEK